MLVLLVLLVLQLTSGDSSDLDFQLFFAHTVAAQSCSGGHCTDPRVPWASSEVQHMAHGGALKNRYRIPFSSSIRITATLPPSAVGGGIIYYYVRGMTALPVVVGDLQLPHSARLRLHKNLGVAVPPMGALALVPKRQVHKDPCCELLKQSLLFIPKVNLEGLRAALRDGHVGGVQLHRLYGRLRARVHRRALRDGAALHVIRDRGLF